MLQKYRVPEKSILFPPAIIDLTYKKPQKALNEKIEVGLLTFGTSLLYDMLI